MCYTCFGYIQFSFSLLGSNILDKPLSPGYRVSNEHRLYCIALHCIALHCIALHCIALHCIVMYCIVLYCIVLYCIVLYCIVLYCIVLYCIVLFCIVLYYSGEGMDGWCTIRNDGHCAEFCWYDCSTVLPMSQKTKLQQNHVRSCNCCYYHIRQ